jgi:hypothetical protein
MWTRKTNEEMAKERRHARLSVRRPIEWFLICFFGVFMAGLGAPIGPAGSPDTFRVAAEISAIVAIGCYVLQFVFRRSRLEVPDARIVMCDMCHRVKHRGSDAQCECGGTFDDLGNWMWIEGGKDDGSEEIERPSPWWRGLQR